uniref:NADH-ubiquinone oxidoreductase chain 1 n=1 Tax=Polydora hoplura TaxID=1495204 RepID=A0A8F9S3F8_9ANNE|nr:NADH dehydrogenase subunit 1 [Polydora hoplura]QYL01504.1 NADH dehydrogenase subunit 1 [Polydora hoplura]
MYSALMSTIILSVAVLITMAFFTLVERKFLAYTHLRKGPNKPSLIGLPQPVADAVKLFIKEQVKPNMSNQVPFYIAPMLALFLALSLSNLMPSPNSITGSEFSAPLFSAIASLNVYASLMAGWASNSKYALLGTVRAMAQTISYEVGMSLCMLMALVTLSSLSLTSSFSEHSWPALIMPLLIPIWIATILAETNRTPYDLVEGESELVSGFNIEYSAGPFAMIFMAEYTSIIAMSMFTSALFSTSASSIIFMLKTLILTTLFLWVRATLPRMRYDNLMYLMWMSFLPVTLGLSMIYFALFFI